MSGYSRIPVHEPHDPEAFIGLLLIKKVCVSTCSTCAVASNARGQLLRYDPTLELPVSSLPLSILPEAHPSINCFQALDYLYGLSSYFSITGHLMNFARSQTGRAHLLLISRTPGKPGGALGVITLEGAEGLVVLLYITLILSSNWLDIIEV
jgi:metal transporter CNNM